jgi:hypothetical protein
MSNRDLLVLAGKVLGAILAYSVAVGLLSAAISHYFAG